MAPDNPKGWVQLEKFWGREYQETPFRITGAPANRSPLVHFKQANCDTPGGSSEKQGFGGGHRSVYFGFSPPVNFDGWWLSTHALLINTSGAVLIEMIPIENLNAKI